MAQPAGGAYEEEFREWARHHGIWLIPGSLFEKRDGAIYNMTGSQAELADARSAQEQCPVEAIGCNG